MAPEINYLSALYNRLLQTSTLPMAWHTAQLLVNMMVVIINDTKQVNTHIQSTKTQSSAILQAEKGHLQKLWVYSTRSQTSYTETL